MLHRLLRRPDHRFSDVAAVPLDLPLAPIAPEAARRFTQRYCEQCGFTDNKIRLVAYYARKPVIDGRLDVHCVTQSGGKAIPSHFEWDPQFQDRFPEFVQWADALPFTRLDSVVLVTQTDDVRDHMDIFGNNNSVTYFKKHAEIEPANYRVRIFDPDDHDMRDDTFYVCRDYQGKRDYVRLPPGTNAFATSSSICYHGAKHHPARYKTTVVFHSRVDPVRHRALIARSVEKYPDYCIRYSASPAEGPAQDMPYRGAGA